jgi:uncharacterized peroxidase-related enzyme
MAQDAKLHDRITALDLGPDAARPPELEAYFDKCRTKLGFVPNVLQAYAFDAGKLANFVAFHDELMLGASGLSKLEREMIAVVVSSANHCHYCLVAHGAVVRKLSGDARLGDALVHNYRAAEGLSPKQRAMLDFAWALTKHPEEDQARARQGLRAVGWSDRDVWDIAAVAGFFNMTNRLAAAAEMRPNAEYHSMAR